MHESSLARHLLERALEAAARAGGGRVVTVRAEVAETEHLSAEAIELHFRAHARATAAEGARLELRLEHVEARCRACGEVYRPEHHVLLCPRCGATDGEELRATGITLGSVDVDDGPSPP